MKKTFLAVVTLIFGLNLQAQKTEISVGYGVPSALALANMFIHMVAQDPMKSTGVLIADVKLYNENEHWRYGLGISLENFNYELSSDKISMITINPAADYFWTKPEKKFRWYSGVSAGILFYNYKEYYYGLPAESKNITTFAFNITTIGMRYGEDFAVFLEPFNIGTRGTIQAGISYRF